MNYLNGGYAMIKHNATQKDLAAAYKSNRPVLVYDENQKAHWAQINETVTTETIDDEVVTTYTYSYQLLNDIASLVDSAGNPRFIEGDGIPIEKDGVEVTYCKWSLCGTHLMLVCAGNIASGTVLTNSDKMATYELPNYILDKIVPTFSNVIEMKGVNAYNEDWSTQGLNFKEWKYSKGVYFETGALTLSKDRSFRVQFDLLIDTYYSE